MSRSALPALLTGLALALPFEALAGPPVGKLEERISGADVLLVDDAIGADLEMPVPQVLGVAKSSAYRIEGPLPVMDLRAGPFIAYNNTAFCDPNNVTISDFNATFGPGGLLDFLNGLCGNANQRFGCDPNDCTSTGLSGPLYYQDSGTSIPTEVNGFSFLYASDHASGAQFVPPDLDMDGDVDTGDFALFAPCFAPATPVPPGCVPMDFDSSGFVNTTDFALFGQCFGGSLNPPSISCPFGQGGGGGNQIDMNICFSAGTDSNAPNATGTIIVDDFSGSGGSSASRAIYTCVDLPGDNTPGNGSVAFIQVDVDLAVDPPTWTATRFVDSAVFTGAVQKDGVVPASADRLFNLPGGSFGINLGSNDNTIEALVTVFAHGGSGNQNGLRVLDQSPACDTVTNPCGTPLTPDLTVILVDPSNGNCTFDNCVNCTVENSGLWFVIQTMEVAGEPNETIDPDLPTVIVNDGCFSTTLEIGGGQGPTDVDLQKVTITSTPRRLVAYAEGVGTPPNRGNPLLRVFDSTGNELASNDTDGRPENSDLNCPPHAGVNALVGVEITASGDYYVGVSGGGCDRFLLSTDPVNPCEPDLTATCNDDYDPVSGTLGTAGVEGVYTLTLGVTSLTPSGSEPNDDLGTATAIVSLPFDSGPGAFTMGDGPFGGCLGDFDYYFVEDAITTDGRFLDVVIESNATGTNTDSFVIVYETDAGSTTLGKRVVAVHDSEAASFDARALAPILAGKDYYVMVMGTGTSGGGGADTRGVCFRQFGGFTEFEPGFDSQASGGGDSVPGANGSSLTGGYRLTLTQRVEGAGFGQVPPANTGPLEPNDSIAQAAVNAVLTVVQNQTTPASAQVFMGDGRYGWALALVPTVIGDVDIFKIEGLDPNDLLEAVASPQGISTANLFNWIAQTDQIIATPNTRLTFPNGGISSQTLSTIVDPNDTYVVVTPFDNRPDFLFNGNLLPWDLTIPGTLLTGNFSGDYNIAVKSRSVPPPALAGSRMWGAFRGNAAASIVEMNPNTGTVVNSFAVPTGASVNGASTGLAYAKTPPGRTADVLYYLNTQGTLVQQLRMWELNPDTGAFAAGAPGTGFTNLNSDTFISGVAGISLGDLVGGTDGLGYAGTKLWMCNQNQDKIVRWNTVSRRGDAFLTFTASPFFRQCRDGLEGSDDSNLGSGSVIWVAARENRTIVLVDVGTNANGPNAGATLQDRVVLLGEMDDPTFQGGAGDANTGGLAVLPQDPGALRGAPFFNLYVGNINTNLTDVVESEDITGSTGTVIGGWLAPDFGASGYTADFTPPAEARTAVTRGAQPAKGARLARQ